MNSLAIIPLALAGICAIYNVVVQIIICHFLSQRGHNTSILFLGIMIFKYISQYKAITIKESGTVGTLFYQFIISINLALLFTFLGFIVHVITN